MAPGQQPDIVEALTDDTNRYNKWKPGEQELVERQTAALEDIAETLHKMRKDGESSTKPVEPDEGGEEPPKQPK